MKQQKNTLIERESLGIKKVDQMIQGGIPKGAVIGLSGPPGVGKSIFTLHFLLEGARKGQKCVYINLEEPQSNINNMISQFEFADEFNKFIKEEKIVIKCFTYSEYEKIYTDLFEKIKEDKKISRVVIDSFNVFFSASVNQDSINFSHEINIRKAINHTFSMLRRKGLTTLLTLEMQLDRQPRFYYNLPYLVDGLIDLDYLELGNIERRIFISKMRWTNQFKEGKNFDINKRGIVILG